MSESLMPFIWVALTLPILVITQRWIHRHLQGIAFLATGRKNWAIILYAIILFPGVLLHEISHWLMAGILGVKTGGFSVLPRLKPDGSIQLGYVEYYKSQRLGPVRESLVGSAPLISGTAVVLLIAFHIFNVTTLGEALRTGDVAILTEALSTLFATGDFLLWLYLLFCVSNAMMPSASDRRAWPAFILIMTVVAVVLYIIGLQELLLIGLAGPVATVFGYLGLAFSLTIGVNLFSMFVIHVVEWILSRIKGVDLVYSKADVPPTS
ncbi:MAG: hypothetical protein WAM60_09000 [Candidatus Promineifilaceae bacterium]